MDLLGRSVALKDADAATKGAHLKEEIHDNSNQECTYAVVRSNIKGDCNRQEHNQYYSDCSHSFSAKDSK
jgi:hypothetical protein